ncbi:MAG TPA: M56 family metallopeptidase [Terriglobales bacterium]|jgi:beta-lactamase regulating signal transducer with metallopeptidase domain
MFALRIAVSLDCFLLLYCLLSLLVETVWRPLKPLDVAQQSVAAILFALRILPLVASLIITFALVVPSLQLLQPLPIDESMGAIPVALGVCALLWIAWGFFRAIAAQTRTTRAVTCWLEGARPLPANDNSTATFQSRRESPPLIVVGVRRPRVLVSESTVALLTPDELRMALQHEHEHMKSRDNLKRLILVFCPFPGMAKLESAWSQAAELAADDAAVSSQRDALDLAAALVKLSRLVPVTAPPVCSAGFVAGSVSQRIERLLAWDEASKARRVHIRTWFVIPFAVAVSLLVSVAHGPVLAFTHEITEWLVR